LKDKWKKEMEETAEQVFSSYEELKTVCQISQNFKQQYDISNQCKTTEKIKENLHRWYLLAAPVAEFRSVIKCCASTKYRLSIISDMVQQTLKLNG
jgi:hypothetical protein